MNIFSCSHNGSVLSVGTGRCGVKAGKASRECDVSAMIPRGRSSAEDVCDSHYLVSVQMTREMFVHGLNKRSVNAWDDRSFEGFREALAIENW